MNSMRFAKRAGRRMLGTGRESRFRDGFASDLHDRRFTHRRAHLRPAHRQCLHPPRAAATQIGSGHRYPTKCADYSRRSRGHADFSNRSRCSATPWAGNSPRNTSFSSRSSHYDITTKFFTVKKGQCCGIHRTVIARSRRRAACPHGSAHVSRREGPARRHQDHRRSAAGSARSTAAWRATAQPSPSLVNAIPRMLKAPPGVLLMTDVAVPGVAMNRFNAQRSTLNKSQASFALNVEC